MANFNSFSLFAETSYGNISHHPGAHAATKTIPKIWKPDFLLEL